MRNRIWTTALGVALLGTVAVAQSVHYDFDRAADFSRFQTYVWTHGTNLSDQLNHTRIVRAVETQLQLKGLRQVEGQADADVLVAYHADFDEHLQINGHSTGFGPPRFGHVSGTATTHRVVAGTLTIDITDARTGALVWRGVAERDLDAGAKPEKREKNIAKAAEKIFKNYPPKA